MFFSHFLYTIFLILTVTYHSVYTVYRPQRQPHSLNVGIKLISLSQNDILSVPVAKKISQTCGKTENCCLPGNVYFCCGKFSPTKYWSMLLGHYNSLLLSCFGPVNGGAGCLLVSRMGVIVLFLFYDKKHFRHWWKKSANTCLEGVKI